jgi:hypothetical protein
MAATAPKTRTETRMALREAGLQDTQRSWTNYVGKDPALSWIGTNAYYESPVWGPNAQRAMMAQENAETQKEEKPIVRKEEESPRRREVSVDYGASPFAFSPFGSMITQPNYFSPITTMPKMEFGNYFSYGMNRPFSNY